MNTPLPALMRAYDTTGVFFEKTAGERPLAARVGDLAWGRALLENSQRNHEKRQLAQAAIMNTAFRVLELARMESAINNAGHTPAPMILPEGYDLPVGMTEGMVRLAAAVGSDMAKEAALGPFRSQPSETTEVPSPHPVQGFLNRAGIGNMKGLKRTAIGLGATALAVGGGLAALHKGLSYMGKEPHTPSYNAGGYQLPSDVNEYGQTQGRLPTYR